MGKRKRLVRVTVTAEDIASGPRGHCGKCPVARAMLRACGADRVRVADGQLRAWRDGCYGSWRIPPEVGWFIDRFDAAYAVSPIAFDLEWPEVDRG